LLPESPWCLEFVADGSTRCCEFVLDDLAEHLDARRVPVIFGAFRWSTATGKNFLRD
jgi:hypothetical protein